MTRKARVASFVLALTAAALVGLLAGCSASTSVPARSAPVSAAPSPDASAARPTIKVIAPEDGAAVAGGELKVQVETTGLKFVMPGNTRVPGEGHVHLTLDGQPFKMSTTPDYVFKDVSAGPHTLKAELVQNDTKPFDPPVLQTVKFTVN